VSVTYLSGRGGRLDITLDGLIFRRTQHDAARLGTAAVHTVDWDDVLGAEIQTTGKGRAVVRVAVLGATATGPHRDDPYALKAQRGESERARELADRINEEVGVRRRWRDGAPAEPEPIG